MRNVKCEMKGVCKDVFRFKSGADVSYNKQGYIYFVSRRYRELPEAGQKEILNLCIQHGGEYYKALFEYVTTDAGAVAITRRHFISKPTLYRIVKAYYEGFPDWL